MGYPHKPHAKETVVLSKHFGDPEARTYKGWVRRGGYDTLHKALATDPAAIIEEVKASGLRGRGGAGFPTGLKWSFMPKEKKKPHYLCVNADESEPGTFKDREIMRWTPHALLEGTAIAAHAIRAEVAYIYVRGEFTEPLAILEKALAEASTAGVFGSIKIYLHRGAGAYICGEETALMNSIEGKRGNPRIKPPFPAASGVFGMPTTINNVETLVAVPPILKNGAAWYKAMSLSNPKSTGTKLFSVCGHIAKPGNYEVTMGFPLKDLLYELSGGMRPGRTLKACIPGGSSVPILNREESESCLLDYEGCVEKGTMLGSGGVIVFDDTADNHAPCPLLRPRVVRPVHPVPRRHRLDHQDPGAHPGRAGRHQGPRLAARPRRQHDGEDDLRALGLVRGAGGERDQEVQERIRGVHRGEETPRGGLRASN